MGADAIVGQAGCVCAQVKSIGQPDAGNPHVRLDEGPPAGIVRRGLLYTHHVCVFDVDYFDNGCIFGP